MMRYLVVIVVLCYSYLLLLVVDIRIYKVSTAKCSRATLYGQGCSYPQKIS